MERIISDYQFHNANIRPLSDKNSYQFILYRTSLFFLNVNKFFSEKYQRLFILYWSFN